MIDKRMLRHRLLKAQLPVSFHEKEHRYFVGGKEAISVTTLIKKYTPKFDPSGRITKACAAKQGITPTEMKAVWDQQMKEAGAKGTLIHTAAEMVVSDMDDKVLLQEPHADYLHTIYDSLIRMTGEVVTAEQIVFSEEFLVAGQVDLLRTTDGVALDLYDWKTNKEITIENKYGQMMLGPLSHLPDTHFTKYSLQLSLYKKLIERMGFKVGDLWIIHLLPDGAIFHRCHDYVYEAELMLQEAHK